MRDAVAASGRDPAGIEVTREAAAGARRRRQPADRSHDGRGAGSGRGGRDRLQHRPASAARRRGRGRVHGTVGRGVRGRSRDLSGMRSGPRNPFLADSGNAMAHGRCDQQDNTPGPGPEGPTDVLGPDDIQYAHLGPGHFGGLISGRYTDGRRVIWSNGASQTIAKLDYDTLEVLATFPTGTEPITGQAELDALEAGLDEFDGDEAVAHAIDIALRFMTGLDGVYSLLDCDHTPVPGPQGPRRGLHRGRPGRSGQPHRRAGSLAPARRHRRLLRRDQHHLRRPPSHDHRPRVGGVRDPGLQPLRRRPASRRRHRRSRALRRPGRPARPHRLRLGADQLLRRRRRRDLCQLRRHHPQGGLDR